MTRPLEGIRVADFTVHNAGPFATHLLGQLGAEIIKVESAKRLDIFRKPPDSFDRYQRHGAGNKLNDISGRGIYRGDFQPGDRNPKGNFAEALVEFEAWWAKVKDKIRYDDARRAWVSD